MQVSLKVVGGKNDGREIKIAVPEFIIGRGEEAHLKPTSDLVSRQHCAIRISDGKVFVEDLKSRNGTFVNGQPLKEIHIGKIGDTVRVGRLQFELMIDHVAAGNKKPRVQDVVEAAARTAATGQPRASIENSIASWLVENMDEEPLSNEKHIINHADTVQMNLEDTMTLDQEREKQDDEKKDKESEGPVEETISSEDDKKKKKEYGKLPSKPKMPHGDSTNAADDTLRQFFSRRM